MLQIYGCYRISFILNLLNIAKKELEELGIDASKLAEVAIKKQATIVAKPRPKAFERDSGLTSQEEEDYEMVRRDMPKSFVRHESSDGEGEDGEGEDGESEYSDEDGSSVDPSDVDLEDQSSEGEGSSEGSSRGSSEGSSGDSEENSSQHNDGSNTFKKRRNTLLLKENKTAISNAHDRRENYIDAIVYCKTHNINLHGTDEIIKGKRRTTEVIDKMKKSKDAKIEAMYLPSEISPEILFGKPSTQLNKEKADMLSLINKSISDHQKLIQNVQNGNFKSKADMANKEKEIQSSLDKQIEIKHKLEIIQTNRWWPVPEISMQKASFSIPMDNPNQAKGEKVTCSVLIKKQPDTKGDYELSVNAKDGHNETRKIPSASKSSKEEFIIPINKLDDIKDYICTLTKKGTKTT
jgi:hypothetical protein